MPKVAVLGASGYAGALAAALLHRHPRFELTALTSRSDAGKRLDALYPRHRVPMVMEELDLDRHADGLDAAVVAYPHHAAAPVVAGLRERGVRVVDLSADFRLFDQKTYERWYGSHPAPELIDEAVYGLPELGAFHEGYRERIAAADLVANPGCFPTAAVLALAPIVASSMTDVVIDAKTGVSGAGRAATDRTHFVTVTENVTPYGVDGHRHEPEITQQLAGLTAIGAWLPSVTFIPHLVPLDQGELISAYATLEVEVDQEQVQELYVDEYSDEPFVEVVDRPPGVREVRETNLCRIAVRARPPHRVLVFAAIDNLWKGTSSQAVQNLNLMFGFPEGEGIS